MAWANVDAISVQNEDVVIRIGDQIIKQVEHTKYLGVRCPTNLVKTL